MIVFVCSLAAVYLALSAPRYAIVAPALAVSAINPLLGLSVGAALVGRARVLRIRRAKAEGLDHRTEEILAADLVASGVEVGVSFDEAVSVASAFVSSPVASAMRALARKAHHVGHVDEAESVVHEMFRLAGRSAVTGAPLAVSLRAMSNSERQKDAAKRLEALERLPVKLLFPLAFLILPGFLLVAVAPALASGISKLSL